jgi:hypothetical protein
MTKTDFSHDQWIAYVFDHPVPSFEAAWYFNPDEDWWDPHPEQAEQVVAYMTRLFDAPEFLVEQFSESQIGRGLGYLFGAGDYGRFLLNGAVPMEGRVNCIRAMDVVFARLFQPRCEPILSHLDEPGGNELNSCATCGGM